MIRYMDVDLQQLRTLAAIIDEGSFDAAADALHITASAVSQRVRALESSLGCVLLVRSRPIDVTVAGEPVLRLARQIAALVSQTQSEITQEHRSTVPLAVNADSLATWILPALEGLSHSCAFRMHREDQNRTTDLLRRGTVMAAVTADPEPIQGCTVTPLGVMRYRPYSTPEFRRRWFADGVTETALHRAPMVDYDQHDELQRDYLARRAPHASPPCHLVPGSEAFVESVRRGFGWGMLPDLQSALFTDDVELLEPDYVADIPLWWQQWAIHTTALSATADAIIAAATTALRPAAPHPSH